MRKQLTPRAGQVETATRIAFVKALAASTDRTKTTGKVYRALCTPAGLINFDKRG